MTEKLVKKVSEFLINGFNESLMISHFQIDAKYIVKSINYNLKNHHKFSLKYISE